MDPQTLTLLWLIAGVALIVAEVVLPGAILGFLGAAAVLVAGARWAGLLDGVGESFAAWLVLSLALTLGLRRFVARWSRGERSVQSTSEDADAFGKIAVVSTAIVPGEASGRIRYGGTTWPARTLSGTLEPGTEVRILDRDNVSWIVEPASNLPITNRDKTR